MKQIEIKKTTLFLLIISLMLHSCQIMWKSAGIIRGIKKPKLESTNTLIHFLDEMDMTKSNVVYLADSSNYERSRRYAFINKYPSYYLFDNLGVCLDSSPNVPSCMLELSKYISLLEPCKETTEIKAADSNAFILKDFLRNTISLEENEEKESSSDYTLLIYWSKFIGKQINRSRVKEWEEIALRAKNVKVNVIKFNIDVLESWPIDHQEAALAIYDN